MVFSITKDDKPSGVSSIFVFGSNLAGIHGAGAAKLAYKKHGAHWGKGEGHYGYSYAIPTKDHKIQTLKLLVIQKHVDTFIHYAKVNPNLKFTVTCVGCGLAGYKNRDIAPMFTDAPNNCFFDEQWKEYLGESKNYWGTY